MAEEPASQHQGQGQNALSRERTVSPVGRDTHSTSSPMATDKAATTTQVRRSQRVSVPRVLDLPDWPTQRRRAYYFHEVQQTDQGRPIKRHDDPMVKSYRHLPYTVMPMVERRNKQLQAMALREAFQESVKRVQEIRVQDMEDAILQWLSWTKPSSVNPSLGVRKQIAKKNGKGTKVAMDKQRVINGNSHHGKTQKTTQARSMKSDTGRMPSSSPGLHANNHGKTDNIHLENRQTFRHNEIKDDSIQTTLQQLQNRMEELQKEVSLMRTETSSMRTKLGVYVSVQRALVQHLQQFLVQQSSLAEWDPRHNSLHHCIDSFLKITKEFSDVGGEIYRPGQHTVEP
ncbi:hypothetical protein BGW42_007627 [Actinomortierella wolfii]|nr:hypothetical protein BGW42_007627 [Actinomortierella wolfii]